MPDTVPLYFSEENITWVASKLSGTAGALGAEETELRNWILCFRCVSDEFIVVVANMEDYMANLPLPPTGYLPCYDGMSPRCNG